MKCRINICLLGAIIILLFTLFLGFSTGKGMYYKMNEAVKRGYILDRNGEPLVINRESFKAYLILKGSSLLGKDIPDEIRPYLPKTLDLPKKGIILLAENLNLDEAKRLSKVENVIVKGFLERKALFEELSPLLGQVQHEEGISGLEKSFNEFLKEGKSLLTSLDLKFQKKVYHLNRNHKNFTLAGIALLKVTTGEVLAYSGKDKEWVTGEEIGGVFPKTLIETHLKEICEKNFEITLLPKKEELCKPSEVEVEELKLDERHKKFLYLYRKGEFLVVLLGELKKEESSSQFEGSKLESLKKELHYLAQLL